MGPAKANTLLLVAFSLSSVAGCGGGGGSSATTPTQVPPSKQIFVSDLVLEPAFSISSQGSNLYVGTQFGLVEIDSTTGTKRTVAGNQEYVDAYGGFSAQTSFPSSGLFDATSASVFVPLHPANEAKMASASLSTSLSAPNVVIPQRAMAAMPNFRGMTANATQAFWMGFDGNTTMNVYTEVYGQASSYQKIASVTAADGNMATYGDYLYLYTDETSTPTRMIFRYQISTGNLVAVQQPRSIAAYTLNFPLVAASNGVYWAEGKNIYFLSNSGNVAQQVGSVGGTVIQLTLAGSKLYFLDWESDTTTVPATPTVVVTQFDTQTSTQTEMSRQGSASLQTAQINGTVAGRIFLAVDAGLGINVSEITGVNTLNQLVVLPAYNLKGMYVSPSTLAIVAVPTGTTNMQVYRYNFASTVTDQVIPPLAYAGFYLQGVGESLFITANNGFLRIPLNMPINTPVALQPSPAVNSSWTQGGTSSGGYFYWVGFQNPSTGPIYQLESSMPDGANFAVLLQTSGELRDPTIFNGRVYFLCLDSCGAAGWVIASTTLTGTGQQTEAVVGGVNPRLYQHNGYVYLTTSDGLTSSIIALDMNTWSWSSMVSQLPYTTLYLDFSNKWLYWSGEVVNSNGTPAREVARQGWIDWSHVSSKQQIEWGSGAGVVDDLQVSTLHYFSGNLYYWNHGLVRVPE